MDSENQNIFFMKIAFENLKRLPETLRDDNYANIIDTLFNYLNDNCNHKIIEDSIDINEETSQQIFYCEHCNLSFGKT